MVFLVIEYAQDKRAHSQDFHHRYFRFSVPPTEHAKLDVFARDRVICPRFVLVRELAIRDIVTQELTEAAPTLSDLVNKKLVLRHQTLKRYICKSVTHLPCDHLYLNRCIVFCVLVLPKGRACVFEWSKEGILTSCLNHTKLVQFS